jgi:hypothetical protein
MLSSSARLLTTALPLFAGGRRVAIVENFLNKYVLSSRLDRPLRRSARPTHTPADLTTSLTGRDQAQSGKAGQTGELHAPAHEPAPATAEQTTTTTPSADRG